MSDTNLFNDSVLEPLTLSDVMTGGSWGTSSLSVAHLSGQPSLLEHKVKADIECFFQEAILYERAWRESCTTYFLSFQYNPCDMTMVPKQP